MREALADDSCHKKDASRNQQRHTRRAQQRSLRVQKKWSARSSRASPKKGCHPEAAHKEDGTKATGAGWSARVQLIASPVSAPWAENRVSGCFTCKRGLRASHWCRLAACCTAQDTVFVASLQGMRCRVVAEESTASMHDCRCFPEDSYASSANRSRVTPYAKVIS